MRIYLPEAAVVAQASETPTILLLAWTGNAIQAAALCPVAGVEYYGDGNDRRIAAPGCLTRERRKTMKLRHSLLWLGAPVLFAALVNQAAGQGQQMQQMQQMHKTQQQATQQAESGQRQDCTRFQNMDRSKMNMNDPATQQMMQRCNKMMQGGQMQGGQMQGGGMQGGHMQGGHMQGGHMMGGQTQGDSQE